MKNIINSSELQRKGLKEIYETIDQYGQAFIVNQRSNKVLRLIDDSNPHLLINIIKSLKSIKKELKDNFGITRIGIFGSYSKGVNNQSSVLDLIIDFKYNDLKELIKIEEFIEKQLNIPRVEIVTEVNINAFAKATMEQDVIYV